MNRLLLNIGLVMLWAGAGWAGPRPSDVIGWPPKIAPARLAWLTEQMSDPNAQTRVRAMEEVGRLHAKEAWKAIAGRLGDQAIVRSHGQTVTVAAVTSTEAVAVAGGTAESWTRMVSVPIEAPAT